MILETRYYSDIVIFRSTSSILPRVFLQQIPYNIFIVGGIQLERNTTPWGIQDVLEKKLFFSSVATAAKSTALSPLLANRNQYFHNMAPLCLARARCKGSSCTLWEAFISRHRHGSLFNKYSKVTQNRVWRNEEFVIFASYPCCSMHVSQIFDPVEFCKFCIRCFGIATLIEKVHRW